MSIYIKQDIRIQCDLIARALRSIAAHLEDKKTDWVEVRRNLQRIEDRAAETQQMAAALRGVGV